MNQNLPDHDTESANQNSGPSRFVRQPIDAGLSENIDEEEGISFNEPGTPEDDEQADERTTLNTSGVQEGDITPESEEIRGDQERQSA